MQFFLYASLPFVESSSLQGILESRCLAPFEEIKIFFADVCLAITFISIQGTWLSVLSLSSVMKVVAF